MLRRARVHNVLITHTLVVVVVMEMPTLANGVARERERKNAPIITLNITPLGNHFSTKMSD